MTRWRKRFAAVLVLAAAGILVFSCAGKSRKTEIAAETEDNGPQLTIYKPVSLSDKLSTYKIAYYDKAEITQEASVSAAETEEPFTIVDFGPQGELPSEIKKPSIYVVFSQPVIPISKLGSPVSSSDVMDIYPPVKGVFRWYGTRLLSFDAEEDVLPQREYTVRINPKTTSLGGKPLTGDNGFTFKSEYLSVRSFTLGAPGNYYDSDDVPPDAARTIRLTFSYPVNLELIKNFLVVEARNRNYPVTIDRPKEAGTTQDYTDRTVVLTVNETLPENTDVEVLVLKGARSEKDFLGIPENISNKFHTLRPFRFDGYDTYSWSFPRSKKGTSNPLYLEFSHPVESAENLAAKLRTNPAMPITPDNIEVWGGYVRINNLPVEPESAFTLNLDASIKDMYGRSLGRGESVRVEVPPAMRYAYFPNTGTRMLESQFPKRIVWEMQNVFDGVFKAGKITDPYRSFAERDLKPYDFSSVKKNTRHFEVFDFNNLLDNGKGWVGFSWNFEALDKKNLRPSWGKRDLQLQITDLAVTTRYAYNKVVVLVSSLSSGEPVPDAAVSIMRNQEKLMETKSDKQGLAILTLNEGQYTQFFKDPNDSYGDLLRIGVIKENDKIEFKPNFSHNMWSFGIYNYEYPIRMEKSSMVAYLFTDRGLYKPGETVTFKGIDQTLRLGKYSAYKGPYSVEVRETRYSGEVITTLNGTTSDSGGFFGTFTLPPDVEPGYYQILYMRDGQSTFIPFQVANFRRLGFSVSIEKPDITYYVGDALNFKVGSEYLSGGGLTGGTYEYSWYKDRAYFRPPGEQWESWVFGPQEWDGSYNLSSRQGSLSPLGEFYAKQETTAEGLSGSAYTYHLEARVADLSNQQVAKQESAVVHPASFYLGAKLDAKTEGYWSPFVEKGKKTEVAVRLVKPDGGEYKEKAEATVELIHSTWKLAQQQGVYDYINSRWEQVDETESKASLPIQSGGGITSVTPAASGSYKIRLTSADKEGRPAVTELSFYSTGADWIRWGSDDMTDINLKPDKPVYKPGDTAKLLLQTPLPEGWYLITTEREGIYSQKVTRIKGSATLIEVPITEDHVPIVYVSVASYSKRTREPDHSYFEPDLDKPKGYFGVTSLMVDTASRLIDVAIAPGETVYLPGGQAQVTLTASNNGKPVEGAELAFLAVDRGVLDLIDYHVPDPLAFFYSMYRFPLGVLGADSRSLLIDPVTYQVKNLNGGDDGKGDGEEGDAEGDSFKERKDFNPTAVFEPSVKTDRNGRATVTFKLPDTLTTYRCTAVAVKGTRFGLAEQELKVQNPINVRTAFPRKLRYRDTAVGSILLTNLQNKTHKVTIGLSADILEIDGDTTINVTVPAGKTLEVPIMLLAVKTGQASVTITTKSDVLNEKLTETLLIERPYIYESFTTIGKTSPKEGSGYSSGFGLAEEGFVIPSYIEDEQGELSITGAGSRLATLKEAIRYVFDYPYGCMEQRSARILPLVLFGEYIDDFGLASQVPDPKKTVEEELAFWGKVQLDDGGFPFWPDDTYPRASYYVSLRVAHILYFAKLRGYTIPEEMNVSALLHYLENPDNSVRQSDYLMIYRIYVLSLHGLDLTREANRFFAKGDKIGLSGYGMLGLAYANLGNGTRASQCLDAVKRFIRPQTQTIDLTDTYETSWFYNSQIEQLSLLLMLYAKLGDTTDMTTRVVTTLMQRQKNGYWYNTSDTNWALQAFASLMEEGADGTPDFKAAVSLGDTELMSASFSSPADPPQIRRFPLNAAPLTAFSKDVVHPLRFTTDGTGTLFYTATLTYAIPSEITPARDEGIGVTTRITDLEGNPVAENRLVPGKTYRVNAVISSPRRRAYLALRLPIPSGADILDASFVTTASYREYDGSAEADGESGMYEGDYGYGDEYEYYDYYNASTPRQVILDNEVRYFWDDFPQGKQEVSFLFRTLNRGVYPTPPAMAECMYEPEVFGRTEGTIFIIDNKE